VVRSRTASFNLRLREGRDLDAKVEVDGTADANGTRRGGALVEVDADDMEESGLASVDDCDSRASRITR
jgi:hypothetical protein